MKHIDLYDYIFEPDEACVILYPYKYEGFTCANCGKLYFKKAGTSWRNCSPECRRKSEKFKRDQRRNTGNKYISCEICKQQIDVSKYLKHLKKDHKEDFEAWHERFVSVIVEIVSDKQGATITEINACFRYSRSTINTILKRLECDRIIYRHKEGKYNSNVYYPRGDDDDDTHADA